MLITVFGLFYLLFGYIVFCLLPGKARAGWLLLLSVIYLYYMSPRALYVAVGVSILTFGAGLLVERLRTTGAQRTAKLLMILFVGCAVALLFSFKYMRLVLPEGSSLLSIWIMPIGFSFYILQSISYVVDIYLDRTKAERDPISFFLYLLFFPRFISGPIEEKESFTDNLRNLPQVVGLDPGRLSEAVLYMTWGIFMKMMIADRISPYVASLFEDSLAYSTSLLLLGIAFYSIQLYADFAGYSLFAIGAGLLFGVRLSVNFDLPYFAENISDFWRRWHITLGRFLRNYVYIPLGGSRKGLNRTLCNLMIVFVICGMWHGSGGGFLVWGIVHGLYRVIDKLLDKANIQALRRGILGHVLTVIGVWGAWVPFRAESFTQTRNYFYSLFTSGMRFHSFVHEIDVFAEFKDLYILAAAVLILWIAEWIASRRGTSVPGWLQQRHVFVRILAVALILGVTMAFGVYGPALEQSSLLYMEF